MKRKKHSAGFKFKVALAAHKGDKTIHEICQQHEIAASLVHKWKKELQEQGVEIFSSPVKKTKAQQAEKAQSNKIRQLYEKVGQLTLERDFLKKNWDDYQDESD
jgi:transposase-like protein